MERSAASQSFPQRNNRDEEKRRNRNRNDGVADGLEFELRLHRVSPFNARFLAIFFLPQRAMLLFSPFPQATGTLQYRLYV